MALIDSDGIFKKANRIVRIHESRDPEKLARWLGVDVLYFQDKTKLLGMYLRRWHRRMIFLTPYMSQQMTQMVLAHELGHDALHADLAKLNGSLSEFVLFNMQNQTEYEANAFAAHLLIDTEETLELSRENYDVVQMARYFGVNVNLMLIKTQEMGRLGYRIHAPWHADARFLSSVEDIEEDY